MLMDRIIGALTFRKGVYREVEEDTSFTPTAWMLVIVVAILANLGSNAAVPEGQTFQAGSWLVASLFGAVGDVIGFAVMAAVVAAVGRGLFQAQATFDEMVRTLGLANIWRAVGFIGIVGALGVAAACLAAPLTIIAALLGLVAWFIAVHEALDLGWGQTIVTVIIGFIALIVVWIIIGLIAAAIGLTVGGIMGLFSG
jgi:hypothetical protein